MEGQVKQNQQIKKQKEYSGVFNFVSLAGVSVENPDRVIEFMRQKKDC
jgi:hypothetical protein